MDDELIALNLMKGNAFFGIAHACFVAVWCLSAEVLTFSTPSAAHWKEADDNELKNSIERATKKMSNEKNLNFCLANNCRNIKFYVIPLNIPPHV